MDRKTFRTIGLTLSISMVGVILTRIIVSFMSGLDDMAIDTIFSLTVQVLMLSAIPLAIYLFVLKMRPSQIAQISKLDKYKLSNILLAILLGIALYLCSVVVSTIWGFVLSLFGYVNTSSAPVMPVMFNAGQFILSMVLTAVLPAICEEFCMRGAFLSGLEATVSKRQVIVFGALAFGLFHSSITQFGYTMFAGAVLVYVAVKTKSLYPCMVMHFVNNAIGVYLQYASFYGWGGGQFFEYVYILIQSNFLLIFAGIVVSFGLLIGGLYLLSSMNRARQLEHKLTSVQESGYDHTHKRVVLMGEFNEKKIEELDLEKEVFGKDYRKSLLRPSLRDLSFYIGAIVVTSLATIFTFVWGFFY